MKKFGWMIAIALCLGSAVYAQQTKVTATEWHWQNAGDLLGWQTENFENDEVADGVFRGLTKYDCHLLSPPLNIDASQWTDLEFRLKSSVGGNSEVFFRHADDTISDAREIDFSIVGDGQFHTYRVNLSTNPQWKGTITQIRFDPLDPANSHLELQYLRFLPRNTGGLIANGGFEQSGETSSLPQYWSFENAKAVIVSGENSPKAVELQTGVSPGHIQSALFEFPTTGQHQLSVDYLHSKSATQISSQINFFDVFHQPLKSQQLTFDLKPSSSWQTLKSTFTVPPLAAYGQVSFTLSPQSHLTLDNVKFNSLPSESQTTAPWEENWRANWIIAPDAATQENATRYFRHAFSIPNASTITQAKIKVTADNTARVFINGHELPAGPNWDDWKLVDVYDLKPYLQNGVNVIGIVTQNQGGVEGLLAELNAQYPGGEIDINSNKSWRSFVGNPGDGWSKSTFDDSAWKPAQELGVPPVTPWIAVPYAYLGTTMPVKVEAFGAPAQADLGQQVALQLKLIPLDEMRHPTALRLQLVPQNAASDAATYDFSLIPLDTSRWKKGMPVNLKQTVQLPRFFQPGKYLLKAHLTFSTPASGSVSLNREIVLKSPAVAQSPTCKIVYLPGHVPAFEINGKTVPVMHVMTDNAGHDIVKNSRDNNLNLIWLNIPQGFDWEPNAPASFLEMDKSIAAVLDANPHAYVVLNVPIDPVYNPGMNKWIDLHPDQLVKKDDGSDSVGGYNGSVIKGQSYTSPVWLHDAAQSWRELIRHVRSSSYADHVIGYVPISGISWEWFYWGAQSKDFVDYSEPFRQAFSAWTKTQYKGDLALLNSTWKTNFSSFDAIQLPTKAERMAADEGVFLDPAKSGEVIDLREFFTQVSSGDILDFCHIVKEESAGNAICGTYYGYVMYIGRPYFGVHSGHYALGRVLASPDIDFVMSPSRYQDRGLGGGSGFMTTVDSVKLHGKLYIDQADIRTFRADGPGGQLARLNTLKDSVSVLEREFSNTVVNGVASQWYDFGNGWIAGDARMMQAVGKMHQIEETLQHTPRETMDAQNSIAVILSEKSILYTKVDSQIQDAAVNQEIDQLNRSGVAWDNYLLSDLPKIGKYHYYLFLNCFNLTDEQKREIENLKKDGNVLVFVGAPGIINEGANNTFAQATYDPNRVSDVTGFKLKQMPDGPLMVNLNNAGNPLLLDADKNATYGNSSLTSPRFGALNGVAQGTFADGSGVGLAVKAFPGWTSIYSAAPDLPAELLRGIARLAEVPVVNDANGDITYVSKNLFAVHSLTGGRRVFTVGNQYQSAKELFSDQFFAVKGGQFTATVPEGGTVLFLLKTGGKN